MTNILSWTARRAFPMIVLCLAVGLPAVAAADGSSIHRRITIAPSGFNWLANGKSRSEAKAEMQIKDRQLALVKAKGGGSWICSPAGFGQRSKCYRN